MSISAGNTLLPSYENRDSALHLWFVLTEPYGNPPEVVIVNMTSLREDSDKTIILNQNDHTLISHPSSISYYYARLAKVQDIEKVINMGSLSKKKSCSQELLMKIRQGLIDSPDTPGDIKKFSQDKWDNSL